MIIVCGTDFSAAAGEAAWVAAALARAWKLPLQLVHVVDLFAIDSLPPDATQQYLETRERDLEALGAELREQTGATVQTEVRRGLADYELVEYSAACDARLLVVAALGARQAPRWLVGSVSERIARTTRVPALIVRDAQPLIDWARGNQPLRALAAIEHDATSHAALRWVTQLGRNFALDLLIARVVSPVAEQARLGLESTSPAGTLDPALEKRLREDFATWAADLPEAAAAKLVFAPAWGDVDANVGMLASIEGARTIVVGSHRDANAGKFWHGSVAGGVVHRADTNVFVIPHGVEAIEDDELHACHTVLVPTDFSVLSRRALAQAMKLLPPGGTLRVLHVMSPGEADSKASLGKVYNQIPAAAWQQGLHVVPEVVAAADVTQAILQAAARAHADLICMGTHGRTGIGGLLLGSHAQAVVHHATLPVLLVPPAREP